ncbi:MAG TPA: glycosyltransferase [Candidatus Acidoferrum sp.]|nr:glycosyltransferase [Candidatus Acidoferrum sp.]
MSRFHHSRAPLREVARGVHRFVPEYLGSKFSSLPIIGNLQWEVVARQIIAHVKTLQLKDPVFLYSHVEGMTALCKAMRAAGFPLVHLCMDYPEAYQFELIELSDQTVIIPKTVFHELRAKYGEKIQWIPQSIHLPASFQKNPVREEPAQLAAIPRPRLGYLGPIFARLDLPMLREFLRQNRNWHFVYFGESNDLPVPNAHALAWRSPEELAKLVASFDVGLMPYDCTEMKNLHCSPLKLYDYFLAGLPVVATPILAISEFQDLIYSGSTAQELTDAVARALEEPPDSPKRSLRMDVARAHSTDALGQRLEDVLKLLNGNQGQIQ